MKRVIDFLLALVLLVPAVPIVCVVALYVLVVERINPLFVQRRLGRYERPFSIVKLRTMKPSTGAVGTHEAPADAVTATGALLRKYKLDELPQLLNVLVGQMSFVGPRPGLPMQIELAAERRARGVFAARPGITGMGQVLGVDMSRPAELARLDAEYIRRQGTALDAKLLIQTLLGRGFGDRIVTDRAAPDAVEARDRS